MLPHPAVTMSKSDQVKLKEQEDQMVNSQIRATTREPFVRTRPASRQGFLSVVLLVGSGMKTVRRLWQLRKHLRIKGILRPFMRQTRPNPKSVPSFYRIICRGLIFPYMNSIMHIASRVLYPVAAHIPWRDIFIVFLLLTLELVRRHLSF